MMMKTSRIRVKVKANQKVEKVELVDDVLLIKVKALAAEGKANKRVCELVAKHYKIPKSSISIVSGHKSPYKTIEIIDSNIS